MQRGDLHGAVAWTGQLEHEWKGMEGLCRPRVGTSGNQPRSIAKRIRDTAHYDRRDSNHAFNCTVHHIPILEAHEVQPTK